MPAVAAGGLGEVLHLDDGDVREAGEDELGNAVAVADGVAAEGGDDVHGDEDLAPVVGVYGAEGDHYSFAREAGAGADLEVEAERELDGKAGRDEDGGLADDEVVLLQAGVEVEAAGVWGGPLGEEGGGAEAPDAE